MSSTTPTTPSFSSGNESPFLTTPSTSLSNDETNDGIINDPKYFESLEAQSLAENVPRGKPFPIWYFENKMPENVSHIPHDIDGTAFYQITVPDHRWHGPTSDRRHFKMMTTTRKDFPGEVRLGYCRGSFVCTNTTCPFRKTSHLKQPNKVSWQNVRGVREYKVCAICDETADQIDCGAWKMVEYSYSTHVAKVYHIGEHKCWPQVTQQTMKIIQHLNNPGRRKGSAKDVGLEEIVNLIDAGDMAASDKEAEVWVDRRKVKRTIESLKPTTGEDENSFDAVGLLKKKTDQMDKYYIYQVGNVNCGHECDHVFKSSKKMAEIALHMDIDGEENILQLENAYFDATHSRVQNFKSLGMWLVHPAMKKIIRLASMDIRSENHKDIALFFRMFNKMLAEVKGDENYKFNPRYFVCDESGANYKALGLVYGERFASLRAKGCQWHFKQDMQKHVKNVCPDDQQKFVDTCFAMCEATTIADYECLEVTLDEIAEQNVEIRPFVSFWEPHKSHVFKPYRGGGLPGVNMSEQGNRSFKPSVSSQAMRLVHAAKYDTATMMYQEKETGMFEHNLVKASGRGLSAGARIAKERAEQMKVASDFVRILDSEADVMLEAEEAINPDVYIPNAKDKHGAPRKKFGCGGRGQGAGGRGRGNAKSTATRKKQVASVNSQGLEEELRKKLEEKLALAMMITDSELTTGRQNRVDNPPMVIIADWHHTKCKGCRKGILREEKEYPHNMVLRRHGVYGFISLKTKKWTDSEINIHFHLDIKCLRKNDATTEVRYLTSNDEDFCKMDQAMMEFLHSIGFLRPIAEKKME